MVSCITPWERKLRRFVRWIVKFSVITITLLLLVMGGVVRLCRITGDSMYSTLSDGSLGVALPKSSYTYGEIICATIEYKGTPCNVVKRVIGLPGDHIPYEDGKLHRN